LSRPDDEYWFEYLPQDKTVYFQYNQVTGKQGGESLEDFGLRLRDFLTKNEVRNLIVDVRRNNGGSTFEDAEILRAISEFDANKENKIFVFTGRSTFSAASNFIADLDRLTSAVFVGEPSSSTPLMIGGDEAILVLPYSRSYGIYCQYELAIDGARAILVYGFRLTFPYSLPPKTISLTVTLDGYNPDHAA
jgi:hypothetical protein